MDTYLDFKYNIFNYPLNIGNTYLTTIKRRNNILYITGFNIDKDLVFSFIFCGYQYEYDKLCKWHIISYPHKINKSPKSNIFNFSTNIREKIKKIEFIETITNDTRIYGCCLLDNRVRLVGSYNNMGCMYEGKISGHGKWQIINPLPHLFNTDNPPNYDIKCMSTTKNLIIGNYNTSTDSGSFLYIISQNQFQIIEPPYYGIDNVKAMSIYYRDNEQYIICGCINFTDCENQYIKKFRAYTVLWCNGEFSNWNFYNYDDNLEYNTCFNDIRFDGNNMEAVGIAINNNKQISFYYNQQHNIWRDISFPDSKITICNSISFDTIIGTFYDEILGHKSILINLFR